MNLRVAAISVGTAVFALTALASDKTGTEMLFDTGTLGGVEMGTALSYTHTRSADEKIPVRTINEGSIVVALIEGEGKPRTEVTIIDGKRRRKLEHLPVDRGNPIFVTFLESTISGIKFATKGSPFYIRNRIKDAFSTGGNVSEKTVEWDGSSVPATVISYKPFKGDKNAAKLGVAFENLEVLFTMSDVVPGHFVALEAKADVDGTAYFVEEVRFLNAVEVED